MIQVRDIIRKRGKKMENFILYLLLLGCIGLVFGIGAYIDEKYFS